MANRHRLSSDERIAIYNKMSGHCAYCGELMDFKDMQVDHVIPLRKGGEDKPENMVPACRSCNHYKSTLTVEQFRKAIERMPEVLMRDSVTYKNAVRFGLVKPMQHQAIFYFERCENLEGE